MFITDKTTAVATNCKPDDQSMVWRTHDIQLYSYVAQRDNREKSRDEDKLIVTEQMSSSATRPRTEPARMHARTLRHR